MAPGSREIDDSLDEMSFDYWLECQGILNCATAISRLDLEHIYELDRRACEELSITFPSQDIREYERRKALVKIYSLEYDPVYLAATDWRDVSKRELDKALVKYVLGNSGKYI